MGCCLSRTSSTPPTPRSHPNLCKSPPPTLEEETVKEILTETPKSKINPSKETKSPENFQNGEDLSTAQVKQDQHEKQKLEPKRTEGLNVEIRSADIEVSEITVATESRSVAAVSVSVSVSESVSAATVNGDRRGGGEEVISKSRDRADSVHVTRRQTHKSTDSSPAKTFRRRPYSGEQTVNGSRDKRLRSPAKRAPPAPSPEKKLQPRAPRGRSQSPATSNSRNVMNARVRRDSGERSGRRSRSPARNLSQNRAEGLTEVNTKVNASQRQYDEVSRPGMLEEDEACPAADESLDNPLVSLECFIFL